ncbi:MAG: YggT family protein [Wenzhouxiangellaceae bacterium]|nr:YggT family protein [Wenzhouxiangellaceae bacterium]MBS3823864.1 YggT family protein [Wenzhouxiangellaceae bacterium]
MGGSVGNAFGFLVETLFSLYIAALMLRVLLEAVGADYYNPVSQVLITVTQPLVGPLARIIPRMGRFNSAAVVLLLILQTISVVLVMAISGFAADPLQAVVIALFRLVRMLLVMYMVLIIAEVILSWVGGAMRHPIIPLIYQLTRPVLQPIRRLIPSIGGLDLSPLVAIIAIQFLMILIGVR